MEKSAYNVKTAADKFYGTNKKPLSQPSDFAIFDLKRSQNRHSVFWAIGKMHTRLEIILNTDRKPDSHNRTADYAAFGLILPLSAVIDSQPLLTTENTL